jgi:adenylate cyclase
MADIFISYAHSTAARAQQVADGLRALGYHVWRDDELPAHRSYAEVIEERLKAAKAVVVVWSAEAAKSEWVQSEADQARADRKLVQLTIDGAKLPMPFDRIQCADLTGWTGDPDAAGWRKVAESVAVLAGDGEAPRPAPAAAKPAAPRIGICVLPFANMSGEPEQEYFSDGISEDIITDLSKVSALFVVARNTAFAFKGKSFDVAQVAGQLGVSHVLEGSVRKAGGRVRITAQLIDGTSGGHVWAERYDRELTDIFALQDEISQAVVKALKLKLLPEERSAIEQRGTTNAEAYNLYLLARHEYFNGNVGDPRREDTIIRLCRRALALDPDYALAWSMVALAQQVLRFNRGKAGEDGLAAAERAIELDPGLAEPHAVKAMILAEQGGHGEALAELSTAVRLNPDSDIVAGMAARIYSRVGRRDDAIRWFEKATALTESNVGLPGMLMSLYSATGDSAGARRTARITLERAEKVIAQDRNNGHAMAFGASALAQLGEKERAREWMDRALLVDPDNQLMRYNFGCMMSRALGDTEGAIEMLGPVFETITSSLLAAGETDPDLDPLRGDPRFQAMLVAARARYAAAGKIDGKKG